MSDKRYRRAMTAAKLIAIATTTIFLIVCDPVQGAPVLALGATTARVANNPLLDELDALAVDFWRARDVNPPAGQIYLIDRCDCGAYTVGPDIYMMTFDVATVQQHPTWNLVALDICIKTFHEVAHTARLPHTPTGVMAADANHPQTVQALAPWPCRVWARERARSAAAARRACAPPAPSPAATPRRCTPAAHPAAPA